MAWGASFFVVLALLSLIGIRATDAKDGAASVISWQQGTPIAGGASVSESVAHLMRLQHIADLAGPKRVHPRPEPESDFRQSLPENPSSPNVSQVGGGAHAASTAPLASQTLGTSFTGATVADTPGFVPPDTMGAVGPTQFIVTVNGRFRSFSKTTGLADGALNVDPDVFFSSVRSDRTSDPRIRYDRLSGRWFITMIDVHSTNNRILLAVSSGSRITSASNFTFFDIASDSTSPARPSTDFADYDTLGIDANALYIGTNVFSGTGAFEGTDGYVVRKTSVLGNGPIVATVFRNLALGTGEGPFTPQGVDNDDPNATQGFFIGVSNALFGELVLRRVTDPAGSPSISSNIAITVPTTSFPLAAPQTGSSRTLDALDDRLFAARLRDGTLWTAHNIGVNGSGVASTPNRTGVRWYELTGIPTGQTPSIVQSGTIFDPAKTDPRFFLIPSVTVSGQGHAAFGFSSSGAGDHPNAATAGRLAGDTLGTVSAPQLFTNSTSVYAPQAGTVQRWGDYSYTSLDPVDDMTMWTVQEFSNATNSWAVRIVKLVAPPPATPVSANPATVAAGQPSVNITVDGSQIAGSGFYDPGADLAGGAVPFDHISASIGGGVHVNGVTFVSPTRVVLNVSTVGATTGPQAVTVTNPDGQKSTGAGILTISGDAGAPTISSVSPSKLGQNGTRTLTVKGSNFQPGSAVSVSGTGVTTSSVTVSGSTTLTATVKAAANAPTGARDVTTGAASATCTGCLTIDAAPAPASTSPNSGARGATVSVDVLGSHFRAGADVRFGAGITVSSTTFVSSSKLTAILTIDAGTTVGSRTVKVINPDKGTGSCVGCFAVT